MKPTKEREENVMGKKFYSIVISCLIIAFVLSGCGKNNDSVNDFSNTKDSSFESTEVNSTPEVQKTEESHKLDPEVESDANKAWEELEASQEAEKLQSKEEIAQEKVDEVIKVYEDIKMGYSIVEKHWSLDKISVYAEPNWSWEEYAHTLKMNFQIEKPEGENIFHGYTLNNGLILYYYNRVNHIDDNFEIVKWMSENSFSYTDNIFVCNNDHKNDTEKYQWITPFYTTMYMMEYYDQHELTVTNFREEHLVMNGENGIEGSEYIAEYTCDILVDGEPSVFIARFDKNMNILGILFINDDEWTNWMEFPEPINWNKD